MRCTTTLTILAIVLLAFPPGTTTCAEPADGVEFNGATSYAVVEDGRTFDLEAFTVALWVNPRHTGGSQIFLGRGRSGELFTLYLYSGRVRMLVEHEAGRYTHANVEAPPPGVWTHYAGTYDGRQIRLYINGKLEATTQAAGRIPKSDAALYVGTLYPGERVLHGRIDDVRIWSRPLSETEIAAVRSAKSHAERDADHSAGLLARWNRDSLDGSSWRSVPAGPAATYHADPKIVCRKADGYRGIWYSNQRQDDEYVYKYSGGLGTYCAKHRPFAIYAANVDKTFFCYGGTVGENRTLLHMVSYYDHKTGMVPRPTILLDKHTTDAHDNPVMAVDARGYIWIFSSSHGTGRPSFVSVSEEPYRIESFNRVLTTNFSYTQPYYLPDRGFLFLHTRYAEGQRRLFWMTSPDGRDWTEPEMLAHIEMGHYQVSWPHEGKVGTAFNLHPAPKGLNWRTNLYYVETDDFGRSWHNARGEPIHPPLTEADNPALVYDFRSEGRNVYLKDLAFDSRGRPVILFLTSGGWQSGPVNDPRTWQTARWTGQQWEIAGSIRSDNNYDMGSLYIESDSLWRIIGPTEPGPQPYNTGGEVAVWTSSDRGRTWKMTKQLTHQSPRNHTYCRKPINAHPDFYALWADGNAREVSQSRLYFCNREGDRVFVLPAKMEGDFATPQRVEAGGSLE